MRRLDRRGVAALEFAFVLPVLLLMAFGLIDFGRAIWFQTTLDYAVQAAARCAAINTTTCADQGATQSYAVGEAFGLSLAKSDFTVTTGATCASGVTGVQVATNGVTLNYILPAFKAFSGTLSASACYPT